MAKSTLKNHIYNANNPSLNTNEVEGHIIAKEYRSFIQNERRQFKKLLSKTSWFYRLGELLIRLKSESELGYVTREVKQNCGINNIDKQRLSESVWLVTNYKDCETIMKNSKKGYSNIRALQRALKAQEKANEVKSKDENIKDITPNANIKDITPTKNIENHTEEKLKDTILYTCSKYNLDLEKVISLLKNSKSNTEDTTIQAYKVSAHKKGTLPKIEFLN